MWILPNTFPQWDQYAQDTVDSKEDLKWLLGIYGTETVFSEKKNQNIEYSKMPLLWRSSRLSALNLAREMEQCLVDQVPIWTDLKTFDFRPFRHKLCCLTGGYPCQPFSQAGNQLGVLDPRHLFPYIANGIGAAQPVLCYFENVHNHLNIGYEQVREQLQALGYTVEEGIFSAEQVGAPHLRKRLFILAVANPYCTVESKKRGDLAKMLGLQKIQREPKHSSVVSGGDGSKLGNSNGSWEQQSNGIIGEGGGWTNDSGQKLEHSDGSGCKSGGVRIWDEKELSKTSYVGEILDDPQHPRLERHDRHDSLKTRWQNQIRSIASASVWPAPQGQHQHPWEPPRLESRMGFDVDGFNFAEDLLRMAGNGVVPQQACAAFLTLIQKFLQ